jgi:tetratricopeptide (TPR) repeat protein
LACLCGFEFGKSISNQQKEDVELKLKVPILNNLALCLMGQKKYERAIKMLDQVLKIDNKQEKALIRKCTC